MGRENRPGKEVDNNPRALFTVFFLLWISPAFPDSKPATWAAPAAAILKVDDFESSKPAFGAKWWTMCDNYSKLSPKPFAVLPGGSPKSPGHCAGIKGYMGNFKNGSWAALFLSLDPAEKPVNLSAYKAVRFYAQGDGSTHFLGLKKTSRQEFLGLKAGFIAPKTWTQVTIPFKSITLSNGGRHVLAEFDDVSDLIFSAGDDNANFDIKIDDVEFLK